MEPPEAPLPPGTAPIVGRIELAEEADLEGLMNQILATTRIQIMQQIPNAEQALREAAHELSTARYLLAQEYLRIKATSKTDHWTAQKQAEIEHGELVLQKEAEYEIALARLRRI